VSTHKSVATPNRDPLVRVTTSLFRINPRVSKISAVCARAAFAPLIALAPPLDDLARAPLPLAIPGDDDDASLARESRLASSSPRAPPSLNLSPSSPFAARPSIARRPPIARRVAPSPFTNITSPSFPRPTLPGRLSSSSSTFARASPLAGVPFVDAFARVARRLIARAPRRSSSAIGTFTLRQSARACGVGDAMTRDARGNASRSVQCARRRRRARAQAGQNGFRDFGTNRSKAR
jgi:hypothetical protein